MTRGDGTMAAAEHAASSIYGASSISPPIVRAISERAVAQSAEITRLRELLEECLEYFDQRADAEYLPDSAVPIPNEEMGLLVAIRTALGDGQHE